MRAIRGAEIALIPQEPMAAFSPVHTVGDQIVEAIQLHWRQWRPDGPPLTRPEARQITVDLFRDVGISMPAQRLDAYSWQLSGGLRQRAMIAMALSCKPRLLIADEPTTAIDVTTQAQVLNLMRELQRKYRTAVIFITHDLGVIAQIARDVVVMYLGRVMEQGPVDAIFHAGEASLHARPAALHPRAPGHAPGPAPDHHRLAPAPVQPPPGLPLPPAMRRRHPRDLRPARPGPPSGRRAAAGELLPVPRRGGHVVTPDASAGATVSSPSSPSSTSGSSSPSGRASPGGWSRRSAPSTT